MFVSLAGRLTASLDSGNYMRSFSAAGDARLQVTRRGGRLAQVLRHERGQRWSLERHSGRGSEARVTFNEGGQVPGQAEVGHLEPAARQALIGLDEQVRWLQVAVDDPPPVRGGQGIGELDATVQHRVQGQPVVVRGQGLPGSLPLGSSVTMNSRPSLSSASEAAMVSRCCSRAATVASRTNCLTSSSPPRASPIPPCPSSRSNRYLPARTAPDSTQNDPPSASPAKQIIRPGQHDQIRASGNAAQIKTGENMAEWCIENCTICALVTGRLRLITLRTYSAGRSRSRGVTTSESDDSL
jgi:hypothetical protein